MEGGGWINPVKEETHVTLLTLNPKLLREREREILQIPHRIVSARQENHSSGLRRKEVYKWTGPLLSIPLSFTLLLHPPAGSFREKEWCGTFSGERLLTWVKARLRGTCAQGARRAPPHSISCTSSLAPGRGDNDRARPSTPLHPLMRASNPCLLLAIII